MSLLRRINLFSGRVMLRVSVALTVIVLCARVVQQRRSLAEAQVSIQSRRDSIMFLAAERRVLVEHLAVALRQTNDSTPVLVGVHSLTRDTLSFRAKDIDMIYVLSTTCGNCALNLPRLKALHERGVRIVGISGGDAAGSLRSYARDHALPFPLLTRASGPMFRALRSELTPVTIWLTDGTISDLRIGLLSRLDATRQLKAQASIP
jgi:hypothetical protein